MVYCRKDTKRHPNLEYGEKSIQIDGYHRDEKAHQTIRELNRSKAHKIALEIAFRK